MKRTYLPIFIILILMILGCSTILSGNSGTGKGKRKADIFMLPPCEHHLTMIFNENLQSFIFRDDIFISTKEIAGKKTCAFALDRHIFVESFEVNGRSTALDEIYYYMPKNFGSNVRPFRLTQTKRDCKLYEFEYAADSVRTDSISVTLRYQINPMTDFDFCTISEGFFKLNGNYMWFPNSLSDSVDVNLEIITPSSYSVKMDNQHLSYLKKSEFLRSYRAVITDNFKPIIIIGEKKR